MPVREPVRRRRSVDCFRVTWRRFASSPKRSRSEEKAGSNREAANAPRKLAPNWPQLLRGESYGHGTVWAEGNHRLHGGKREVQRKYGPTL